MNYLVTYDLNRAGQNYDGLIDAIKSYSCKHVMQSVWFVKSDSSANEISEHLRAFIDNNDNLFVGEINYNHAGWLPQSYWDFL